MPLPLALIRKCVTDWGNWVMIKQNAAELLEKELDNWYNKHPDKPPIIYMSSVTDPYQPIESKEQLTRSLLEVMAAYRPTLVIQTRSPIITRDSVFDNFEADLVKYLKLKFENFSASQLKIKLRDAYADIDRLKNGQDPEYSFNLTPHVYFMMYLLDNSLKATGFVMLIIQGRKLFKAYNAYQSEDSNQEKILVIRFVEDLGLKLEWYNYISSTGKRTSNRDEFGRFARENLPIQIYMSKLKRQYLDYKYDSHYALDDYVIVAKK